MHDVFEFEALGLPVAYVDTPGRMPRVSRRKGVFVIEYAAARMMERTADRVPSAAHRAVFAKGFEKFGFHRALRLAGAHTGDRIRVGKLELDLWEYPDPILKGTTDGIRNYHYIETPPFARLSPAELHERARELAPHVIDALTT